MKILNLFFCIVIVNISLVFALPQYQVIKDRVRVRLDSTISSDLLGYLNKGELVEVEEEKFNWYKIVLPKRFSCYISKDFVKKVGNNQIEVIANNVNLRTKPSLNSYIIGKASEGARFNILKDGKQWVKIEGYPYTRGWVHKIFLHSLEAKPELTPMPKKRE